jgi:hypothetical protein
MQTISSAQLFEALGQEKYDNYIAPRTSNQLCEEFLLRAHEEHKDSVSFKQYSHSNKIAVIIEPRFDKLTEAVIFNFMYYLNPLGWNLLIVSYEKRLDEIQQKYPFALTCGIGPKHIYFDEQGTPNINIDSYNTIMLDVDFWKLVPVENILIFQRDCIMFKPFDDKYTLYDYVGANYYGNPSPMHGGLNGGFSFRKRGAMISCIENVSWEDIEEYRKQRGKYSIFNINLELKHNEDVFFTHACEIMCKHVPDLHNREQFATETTMTSISAVYHGWNKNLVPDSYVKEMLRGSTLFSKYIATV